MEQPNKLSAYDEQNLVNFLRTDQMDLWEKVEGSIGQRTSLEFIGQMGKGLGKGSNGEIRTEHKISTCWGGL